MKVILNENIDNLGRVGDIVEVKPGYARNYLLPRNLAVHPNKHNMEVMKYKKVKADIQFEKDKMSAREIKEKLDDLTISIEKKAGESDTLFGSVTTMEIQARLEELGYSFDRKKIRLNEHIKTLGIHKCRVKLIEEIEAEITIEVLREGGEPEPVADEAEEVAETDESVAQSTAVAVEDAVDHIENMGGGDETENPDPGEGEDPEGDVKLAENADSESETGHSDPGGNEDPEGDVKVAEVPDSESETNDPDPGEGEDPAGDVKVAETEVVDTAEENSEKDEQKKTANESDTAE